MCVSVTVHSAIAVHSAICCTVRHLLFTPPLLFTPVLCLHVLVSPFTAWDCRLLRQCLSCRSCFADRHVQHHWGHRGIFVLRLFVWSQSQSLMSVDADVHEDDEVEELNDESDIKAARSAVALSDRHQQRLTRLQTMSKQGR